MRVVIGAQLASVAQSYRNAGISRYIEALLRGLDDLATDDEYTALLPREMTSAMPPERESIPGASGAPAPVRTRAVRLGTAPAARVAWEQTLLPWLLLRLGADVYHAPAHVAPLCAPCPCVVTVHDLAFLRYPEFYRPMRRAYQRHFTLWSTRRAARVVAVSHATRRDLVNLLGIPAERITVIYPAVHDALRPVTDAAALAAFRVRHRLPARYVLYLGTLEPRKNLLGLLEGYARLRAREPDTPPLVIAGGRGWYVAPLFERVRALGLSAHVILPGYVAREELALWYSGAALFVYPSLYEGFGLPVVEALACGTPVITSDASSLPEAGGPVATLVPPTDTMALAHAMHTILADTAAPQRALHEGPAWASQFSVARMAQAYSACYHAARQAARTKEPSP